MAIANYGDLKAAVAAFLQRDDLTSHIPTFIELATARFSDELKTPEMEGVFTTTATTEYTALPLDFRSVRLLMANGKPVEYRTPFEMQRLIGLTTRVGSPVYTIQDMQIRLYPIPDALDLEMTYYAALSELDTDPSTNWLLEKRPDVYLYAAIAQAKFFLMDDDRVVLAQQMTDKYITEANKAAKQIAIGSSPLTIRVD